jgi:hypothetical protein
MLGTIDQFDDRCSRRHACRLMLAALATIVMSRRAQAAEGPGAPIAFAGLNPAVERRMDLSNFASGQIVEIDPRVMRVEEARSYIGDLQNLGALVSIYLTGGHCDLDDDCEDFSGTVALGTTGSWKWDKTERRILDIEHPLVLGQLARAIRNGWQLGANFIRIDNLHHPAGSTNPRTLPQMNAIIAMAHGIEDRLHAEGIIPPARPTGLVAHNNLMVWEQLIESKKLQRLPVLLTSERTAQLAALPGYEGDARMKAHALTPLDVPDIQAGRRIAQRFSIPYTIVEFRRSHDLAKPEETYELPQSYVEALRGLSGVSEVVVMSSEDHYDGRPEAFEGPGPKSLRR